MTTAINLPHYSDILIVDDNPENLKVLGDFLSGQGYNVRIARDGRQALENATSAPPEIILLDIHMPHMDGYEACTRMKAHPALKDTPIIFLSALGETFNKVRAFECGGVDYITKPFELEEVRVRVNNHLKTCRLLLESKAGFRASFEQAAVGMAHVDTSGTFLVVNRHLRDIFGYEEDWFQRMRLSALAAPAFEEIVSSALESLQRGPQSTMLSEVPCIRKDGTTIWCNIRLALVTMYSTGTAYVAALVEDISEHRAAIDECRRLAAALEQAADAIAITDLNGVTCYVNAAFERLRDTQEADCVGRPLPLLNDDRDGSQAERMWARLKAGESWTERITQPHPKDRFRTEEYTLSPIRSGSGEITHYVAVIRDLTPQLRLEEQIRQSQKMEAMGTLAAGVAHDFNNLLAVIIGFTEIALEELPKDDANRANLHEVLGASSHATELVRQILSFSRQAPIELRPVFVQEVVEDALKLLRRVIPPNVEFSTVIDKGCRSILADPTAIHQIVMNLCTNAYHAMEPRGGKLTLRVSEVTIEEGEYQGDPGLKPGFYVRLDVCDTGQGMSPETLGRIFDPYFTTKERGSGTGLGLATVHGIIKDLNGNIHVYSELGKGSTFTILLPLRNQEAPASVATAQREGAGQASESILFVDDDRAICQFAAKALGRLGYRTTTRNNPRDALALFTSTPDAFDLIITDELMPDLRGSDLLPELRRIRPDIPVILYSGFSEGLRGKSREELPFNAFVTKPMVVSELSRAIREVLVKAAEAREDGRQENPV